jgi:hypothetical protein
MNQSYRAPDLADKIGSSRSLVDPSSGTLATTAHQPLPLPKRRTVTALPITLGVHTLPNNVFVAPMAGVTDRPFRQLCKGMGAGYAVSEMAASNPRLWASVKSARRINHDGDARPRRCAMSPPARPCCATKNWWHASSMP